MSKASSLFAAAYFAIFCSCTKPVIKTDQAKEIDIQTEICRLLVEHGGTCENQQRHQ